MMSHEDRLKIIKPRLTPEFLETMALICEAAIDGVDALELEDTYRELCSLIDASPREINYELTSLPRHE